MLEHIEKFPMFWSIYPRRVAKKDAEKAWRQVRGDEICDKIMHGLKRQLPHFTEAKFVPYPASWLRAGRWDDELHVDLRPPPATPTVVEVVPQPDPWKAMMNIWIVEILRAARGGIELEGLRKMVAERNRLAKQCADMWPRFEDRDLEVLKGMVAQLRRLA